MKQGYVCKPEITYLLSNAKYLTIANQKKTSNYNMTLVRNSKTPKSNATLTSSKYVIIRKPRML